MLLPHIAGYAVLIRHRNADLVNGHLKTHPKLLVFVGNGAVENGTTPLVKAISDLTGHQVANHVAIPVAAILAQEHKARKHFALKDLAEIIENVGSLDDYLAAYYSCLQEIIFKSQNCRANSAPVALEPRMAERAFDA